MINLINAQSIKGEMTDETIVTLNRFWDTAQDVAMTSLTLAKRIGYQSPDEAYALGLFHNCGIPLMLKRFPQYMAVLEEAYASTDAEQRIVDIENRVLSTNHAVVATSPPSPGTCRCICATPSPTITTRCRCSPTTRGRDAQLKTLLAILKMAEHICACHRVLGGQAEDHEWDSIAHLVLDYVGLSEYDFECLEESIRELGVG